MSHQGTINSRFEAHDLQGGESDDRTRYDESEGRVAAIEVESWVGGGEETTATEIRARQNVDSCGNPGIRTKFCGEEQSRFELGKSIHVIFS